MSNDQPQGTGDYGQQTGYGANVPPQQPQAPQPPYYGSAQPQPTQQPYYAQPQQPAYPANAYGSYGAPAKTNTMAILSLIFAFVFSVLGIVFGHIALSQIKRTGEAGRGLALAGLILGYVFTALVVLYIVFLIVVVAAMGSYSYNYNY